MEHDLKPMICGICCESNDTNHHDFIALCIFTSLLRAINLEKCKRNVENA